MAGLTTPLRTAVLISGRGSNLAALIRATEAADFPAEIACVISSRPDAPGLGHGRDAEVAAVALDHTAFASRDAFDEAVQAELDRHEVDFICLAGFMRLFTAAFVTRWHNRMINIHPSLLPLYPGLHPQAQALEDRAAESGCTVHFVRHATDTGPIIAQARVAILPDDDADRLAARILAAEHLLYPLALRLVAEGRVAIAGETARVDGRGLVLPAGLSLADVRVGSDRQPAADAGFSSGTG
ncbi:MAG: phosphoribosylglycinamide formyltransferase [Alphaproteobacteria bacterium]